MRIADFGLSLPYAENEQRIELIQRESKLEREDAIKQDYRINWKDKRKQFSLETRCMTAFFTRLLTGYKTKDCKKILVECVDSVVKEKVRNLLGVYAVQTEFSHSSFLAMSNYEKKKMTLDLLMAGIRKIAVEQDWDMIPFEETYNKIVESDYCNEWIWQKSAKNKETKNIARILLQHEVEKIDISVIVCDKTGDEIYREKIITEKPDEWDYAGYLGSIEWVDTNTVVLRNKAEDGEITVRL